ncbi:MAG: ribbon-helix-helix protein, CopG family [Thermoguttaceae bacterium]|jgi:predicted transcriptional regulator|nr:ribbon-helix-helix protein, CopG family [Thermoguttaceae bacterium]
MSTTTVNIAFQESLLREIDQVAQSESRSRSELLREAARAYIERKRRWADLFAAGRQIAEEKQLRPGDVQKEIRAYRKSKASRR